ncbi:MAG TPA: hypothetical protein VK929_00665 [Longimicrobiales bacterium]|nr:hypothetical protein [Longimicrobiales bacterium]
MTAPTAGLDPAAAAAAEAGLGGTYESRELLVTAGGGELYLVGVYFGDVTPGAPGDYLLQLGVRRGDGASEVLLVQDRYELAGDSVVFRGGMLRAGRVDREGLSTAVLVDDEWRPVYLTRR